MSPIRDCVDSYSSRAFDASGTGLTETARVATWAEAEDLMTRAWTTFRTGIAAWNEAALLRDLSRSRAGISRRAEGSQLPG
jgi:hypothetical protein